MMTPWSLATAALMLAGVPTPGPPAPDAPDAGMRTAQAPVGEADEDATRRAVTLAAEARAAWADGDAPGAVVRYEQAFDLTRDPAFAFNLGVIWDAVGEVPRAVAWFRAYLELWPEAPNRAQVEGALDELDAVLAEAWGQVSFRSEPAGARVLRVEGDDAFFVAEAPASTHVRPGAWTFRMEEDGWYPRTFTVEIGAGERAELTGRLAPRTLRSRRVARLCSAPQAPRPAACPP
jgi:tetratricopeptide (TPR) repeat protein